MRQFSWGVLAMASLVAALIFLRYWKVTRDRLFIFFALAFTMLSINYVVLAAVDPRFEARHLIYLIRLAGFALIMAGIIDKNRKAR